MRVTEGRRPSPKRKPTRRGRAARAAAPLHVGDRVALGLTSFRVLPNYALATEGGAKTVAGRQQEKHRAARLLR